MYYTEGDYVVVINVRGTTELPDGTYAVVEQLDASGGHPFRYRIRVIGFTHVGERWWIHPNDIVSAEFYCSLTAQKAVRDTLTDWFLDKLRTLPKRASKARAEILSALAELHPAPLKTKYVSRRVKLERGASDGRHGTRPQGDPDIHSRAPTQRNRAARAPE